MCEYRRTIDELVTRYALEPNIRDVYVEGTTDETLLNWFFNASSSDIARVYSISSVSVSEPYPASQGGGGEKGRVIALAQELNAKLPGDRNNVRCVVDKDLNGISVTYPATRHLLVTDFSSMDCYALHEDPLKKFFNLYLERPLSAELLQCIYGVLNKLFALRAAKFEMSYESGWIDDFTGCLAPMGEIVAFDEGAFAQKIAAKSQGAFSAEELKDRARLVTEKLGANPLSAIHKKDALKLLGWYGRHAGCPHHRCNADPVCRGLVLTLAVVFLRAFPMFAALDSWVH